MVNSRQKLKEHFLPVYAIWVFIIPTIIVFLSGFVYADSGETIMETIDWSRVPSIYALFGLIWPLTIVISPAFYFGFREETNYTFFESFSFDTVMATRMFWGTVLLILVWGLPLLHFSVQLVKHKNFVEKDADEKISWLDYLAGYF